MSNEIWAIHFDGQLLQPDIWKQYSDKYGHVAHWLQGWKPPKRFYYKFHHAKIGLSHLPHQIRNKCEIVKYSPQEQTYLQGYNHATKGDDPLYDDGLSS